MQSRSFSDEAPNDFGKLRVHTGSPLRHSTPSDGIVPKGVLSWPCKNRLTYTDFRSSAAFATAWDCVRLQGRRSCLHFNQMPALWCTARDTWRSTPALLFRQGQPVRNLKRRPSHNAIPASRTKQVVCTGSVINTTLDRTTKQHSGPRSGAANRNKSARLITYESAVPNLF